MNIRLYSAPLMLSLMISICPAQAQTTVIKDKSPTIEVLGFYSPSAASDLYARFIDREIASLDPANLSDDQKALFRRLGRTDALQPLTDQDRRQRGDLFRQYMNDAAVFEVLVSSPDAIFDIGKFVQPDPSQPENRWQVAWNEKFLTADGQSLLEVKRGRKVPDAEQFCVVFVIHFWKPDLPLRSGYGELSLPPIQPLPERLWRLAPYELPN